MASYFEPSINQIRGSSNSRVIAACDDYYAIVSGKSAEIINTCTNNSFKFDIPLDSRINSAYLCLYNNLHLITTSESQVMLSTIDSSSTEIISHHCIALDLGFIECISCDETVNFVSVSVANIIYVFDLIQKTTTLLKGHLKSITALKFIDNRNQETCLISSSEDRTYKLWNVQTRRFLFQSEVVSSFAFTALAIDPRSDRNRFCISSEDGQVRFYSFQTSRSNLDFEPRLLTIFKTDKIKNQSEMKEEPSVLIVNSQPNWRLGDMEGNEQYQKEQEVVFKASDRICALHYLSLHEVRLIIGLEESFLILNIDTYDVIFKFDFKSVAMAAESSIGLNDSIVMQTAGSYGFCRNQIITCNTMSNDISIIHLSESFTNRESNIQEILAPTDAIYPLPSDTIETYIKRIVESKNSGIWAKKVHQTCLIQLAIINITSIDKLLQNKTIKQLEIIKEFPAFVLSNLRLNIGQCEYLEKQSSFEALDDDIIDQNSFLNMITIKKTTSTPSKSPFKLNHKLDLMHQPISFRSKVKSSGYSSSPQNTRMFHRPVVAKKTEKKSILPEGKTLSHCYFESSIPIKFTTDKMTHNAPVMCVKYNPSGSLFATSSADKTARIYGSKIKSFSHSSPVSDISWAVNYVPDFGHLFMTIDSANSFVKLWSNEKSDPLLTLGEQTQSKTKYHRIKGMKFFNRDRLIVLSRGPNLQFVTFNIEKSDPSLLQPNLKLSNSTRVIGTLTDVGESTISAFSCINTANSHLVISATSDKKISIWDVNVGKIVRCNENSMKRSIHTISIGDYYNLCNFPETKNIGDDDSSKIGSTTGYGSSQHIFATAAVTDSIKLWDVRKCEAVLHLHGHVNRVGSIGVSMSPCGRYVLTGSEDNQAYVYDIRKASVLCKLSGAHSDIVTSVDFNPVKSEMITGSHDCKIKIWKS